MLNSLSQKLSSLLKEKHLGELLRGGATTFYLQFIGYVIALSIITIISREYGAKVLGEYSLAITILTISSLFARLGFESSMVKLFSQRASKNDWDSIRIIYQKVIRIIMVSGIIVTIILFFGSDFFADKVFSKQSFSLHIKIAAILVVPFALRLVNAQAYRGFKNMKGFAYSKYISYYLYALVFLIALTIYSKNDLNPIIAYATGLIILSITSTYILFKIISKNIQEKSREEITSKSLLNISIPMLLSSASILLSTHLIRLVIGIYETAELVGIFSVALNLVMIQNFIQAATKSIAGPKFAEVKHNKNSAELSQIARHTTNINTLFTIPVTLFLLIFNKQLLGFFGNEFIAGSSAFIIMLLGNAITVLSGPVASYMNMTGLHIELRNAIIIALLSSAVTAVLLIPIYGLIGAAIAYFVFVVFWNIICNAYLKIKYNVNLFFWPFKSSSKN